jgi:hypothetical protein
VTIPSPPSLALIGQVPSRSLTQPFKAPRAIKVRSGKTGAAQYQYHISLNEPLGTLKSTSSSKQARFLSIPLTVSRQAHSSANAPPGTAPNQLQCAIAAQWHISRSIRSLPPSKTAAYSAPTAMITKESIVRHNSVLALPPFYCHEASDDDMDQQSRLTANLEIMLPVSAATMSIDLPSLRVGYLLKLCVELQDVPRDSGVESAGGSSRGWKCLGIAELKIPVEIS